MTYDKEGGDIKAAVMERLASKGVKELKRAIDMKAFENKVRACPPEDNCPECANDDCEAVLAVREEKKASNPKEAFGSAKLPLDIVPDTAIALASLALLDGALKYGKHNWRVEGVRVSTYTAALQRHMAAWENGEEDAPDGVPHLAHALACLAILVDAKAAGKLTDDRPPSIDYAGWSKELTKWVGIVKERHQDKSPRHYTIDDTAV